MQTIAQALDNLKQSRFRASFHLGTRELSYMEKQGQEVIRSHCEDFIRQRLAPAYPYNDGKQTPMKGHPVFIAQHACACCCRGCLEKWYRIPQGRKLTESQQRKIVNLLMAWIEQEMNTKSEIHPLPEKNSPVQQEQGPEVERE